MALFKALLSCQHISFQPLAFSSMEQKIYCPKMYYMMQIVRSPSWLLWFFMHLALRTVGRFPYWQGPADTTEWLDKQEQTLSYWSAGQMWFRLQVLFCKSISRFFHFSSFVSWILSMLIRVLFSTTGKDISVNMTLIQWFHPNSLDIVGALPDDCKGTFLGGSTRQRAKQTIFFPCS